jgi:hypothetical protein
MSLHPALQEARNHDGSRRFYPPGQHPATASYRRHRELLLATEPSRQRQALLDHVDALLAAFEEGESIAKADHLRMTER